MAPYSCFDNIIRCRLGTDSSGPPGGPGPPPTYCCNQNRTDLKLFLPAQRGCLRQSSGAPAAAGCAGRRRRRWEAGPEQTNDPASLRRIKSMTMKHSIARTIGKYVSKKPHAMLVSALAIIVAITSLDEARAAGEIVGDRQSGDMLSGLRHVWRQNRPRIPELVARNRDGRRDGWWDDDSRR